MGNKPSSQTRRQRTNYYGGMFLYDENEIDRVQIQHHFARESYNGNFSSPVKDVLRTGGATVLDVGCGAATFLCEMAADYPRTHYFGVDLLPTCPNTLPHNVKFLQRDVLKGLPFADNTFDFVYVRFLVLDLTEYEWEKVIKECTRVLKPNGWIEMMEPKFAMSNQGPTTERVMSAIQSRARARSVDPLIVDKLGGFLSSMKCLKQVNTEMREVPCGSWGGKKGQLGAMFIRDVVKKHLRFIDSILNIRQSEYDNVLNNFTQEIELHRSYFEFYRYFAQKH
ncbi:S-adenosyl-L-methionine-dependent methyltransferase [Rhizophagus diaphanus]|nr:S-adenosyl-L-methionine-dependent methyltransferase [Rhizophagus diaphanus] [Rhizophagus sp. MUCL 43196]